MAPPFDPSEVSPTDAAVTLWSLRRRFAEALVGPRPDGRRLPDDVLRGRPKGGGLSAIEHAAWTATAVDALCHALRRALMEREPFVELAPVDIDPPVIGGELGAVEVVALVGNAADAMAATIADAHGADWARPARTSDGPVTALDIARRAVRIGVEHLRAADQVAGTT